MEKLLIRKDEATVVLNCEVEEKQKIIQELERKLQTKEDSLRAQAREIERGKFYRNEIERLKVKFKLD